VFKGLIFSLISGCAYGMLAIIIKLGYRAGLAENDLLSYRFMGGALIMGFYLLIRHPRLLTVKPRTLLKAGILGVVFYGLQSTCYFKALTYIPASTSALILYLYPLTVTILSIILFRLRVTRTILLSLGFVVVGCAFVFSDAFQRSLPPVGIMLALGAMLVYSLYLVTLQFFLYGERPLSLTFYAILFTGLMFSAVHPPMRLSALTLVQLGILVSLALVPTVIAITFLFRAIEEIGSAQTSIFSTVEPVVTVSAAYFILQEHIALFQIVGMFLIICGIIYPNLGLATSQSKSENGIETHDPSNEDPSNNRSSQDTPP
jgi:drug/metabolite transporter (DMT)-like permease